MENLENLVHMVYMKPLPRNRSLWESRPTLVTGGTGFIGSWIVKKLLDLGAQVVVLDLKSYSPILDSLLAAKKKNLKLIQGDVCNQVLIKQILREYKIKTIFHLAAQAIVGTALKNPRKTLKTNICGTWNVLEACRLLKEAQQIVVASSDKAYGSHKHLPYAESAPLRGTAPYDVSKSSADLITQMYCKTYHLPICITRCGNTFGGGDLHFSRLIPDAIRSAFYNQTFIIRSDGKYTRDYVYVEDIARGYLLLAELMGPKKLAGQAFNLGINDPRQAIDVVKLILHLMKKDNLRPKILNEAKYEIKKQYLSSEKAKKILGWQPKYSLEEGLKKTIFWYKGFLKRYGSKHETIKKD